MLEENGYFVVYNYYSPLDPDLSLENLQKFDILILLGLQNVGSYSGALYRWSYSESEINNITKYVEDGGGLLLAIDGKLYNKGATIDIYNPLANRFGVQFNNNSFNLYSPTTYDFTTHPINADVSTLIGDIGCTLTLTENATELVSAENVEEDTFFRFNFGFCRILVFLILLIALSILIIRKITTEIGKYNFYSKLSPLHTKLKKDKNLENKTRERINKHIQENPGVNFNSIKHE